jgi:hypothetical protein
MDKFPENIVQLGRSPRKKLSIAQYLHNINEKKVLARKFTAYNSSQPSRAVLRNSMNTLSIRSLLALSVAALLGACGGNLEPTATVQTAAMVQTSLYVTEASAVQAPGSQLPAAQLPAAQAMSAQTAAAAQVAATDGPQPDCAPQGCKALRIIDANAEMYRLEAQRRAAAGEDDGNPAV